MRARVSQLSLFTRVFLLHCESLWFSLCLSTSPCGGSFKRTCQRSVKFWTCFQCPCPWRTSCYWCGKLSGRGSIFFRWEGEGFERSFCFFKEGDPRAIFVPYHMILYHTIWFYNSECSWDTGILNLNPFIQLARLVRSPVLCCYVFRYSTISKSDGHLRFSLLCTHVQMIQQFL